MFGLSALMKHLLFKRTLWESLVEVITYERYRYYKERLDEKGIDYRVRITTNYSMVDMYREFLSEPEKFKYSYTFFVKHGKVREAERATGLLPKSMRMFYI